MRSERTDLQKTNLTSLAATTGIVVFVAWIACFTLQRNNGSLFTNDLATSAPAAHQAQAPGAPHPG